MEFSWSSGKRKIFQLIGAPRLTGEQEEEDGIKVPSDGILQDGITYIFENAISKFCDAPESLLQMPARLGSVKNAEALLTLELLKEKHTFLEMRAKTRRFWDVLLEDFYQNDDEKLKELFYVCRRETYDFDWFNNSQKAIDLAIELLNKLGEALFDIVNQSMHLMMDRFYQHVSQQIDDQNDQYAKARAMQAIFHLITITPDRVVSTATIAVLRDWVSDTETVSKESDIYKWLVQWRLENKTEALTCLCAGAGTFIWPLAMKLFPDDGMMKDFLQMSPIERPTDNEKLYRATAMATENKGSSLRMAEVFADSMLEGYFDIGDDHEISSERARIIGQHLAGFKAMTDEEEDLLCKLIYAGRDPIVAQGAAKNVQQLMLWELLMPDPLQQPPMGPPALTDDENSDSDTDDEGEAAEEGSPRFRKAPSSPSPKPTPKKPSQKTQVPPRPSDDSFSFSGFSNVKRQNNINNTSTNRLPADERVVRNELEVLAIDRRRIRLEIERAKDNYKIEQDRRVEETGSEAEKRRLRRIVLEEEEELRRQGKEDDPEYRDMTPESRVETKITKKIAAIRDKIIDEYVKIVELMEISKNKELQRKIDTFDVRDLEQLYKNAYNAYISAGYALSEFDVSERGAVLRNSRTNQATIEFAKFISARLRRALHENQTSELREVAFTQDDFVDLLADQHFSKEQRNSFAERLKLIQDLVIASEELNDVREVLVLRQENAILSNKDRLDLFKRRWVVISGVFVSTVICTLGIGYYCFLTDFLVSDQSKMAQIAQLVLNTTLHNVRGTGIERRVAVPALEQALAETAKQMGFQYNPETATAEMARGFFDVATAAARLGFTRRLTFRDWFNQDIMSAFAAIKDKPGMASLYFTRQMEMALSTIAAMRTFGSVILTIMMAWMAVGFTWYDTYTRKNFGTTAAKYFKPVLMSFLQSMVSIATLYSNEVVGPAIEGSQLTRTLFGWAADAATAASVGSALSIATSVLSPSGMWAMIKKGGSLLKGAKDKAFGTFVMPEIPTATALYNALPSAYGLFLPLEGPIDLNMEDKTSVTDALYKLAQPMSSKLYSQALNATKGMVAVMETTMEEEKEKAGKLTQIQRRLRERRRRRLEEESSLNSNNDSEETAYNRTKSDTPETDEEDEEDFSKNDTRPKFY